MYTSKYSIPLEIVSSSKMSKSKRTAANTGPTLYSWYNLLFAIMQLTWSLLMGAIYFLHSSWKKNPGIQQLPWFRLIILGVVAFLLFFKGSPIPPGMNNQSAIGLIWSDDEKEDGASEEIASEASIENTTETAVIAKPKVLSNSVAPAEPENLEKIDVQDFITRFSPTAIKEMKLFGIPASIKMGQAIIESQSGNSVLARESNNFFGIKCKSKCKSCTCRNYADDDPYDMFRVFDSPWTSWRAHSKLLCNPRYAKLPLYGKDYKKWAQGLKAAGYATDPKYDKKLIAVIEKYNLTSLDR